jgi:hypothetical protein
MRCYSVRVVYERWKTRQGGDGVAESSYCECFQDASEEEAARKVLEMEREDNPKRYVDRIVVQTRSASHICSARD